MRWGSVFVISLALAVAFLSATAGAWLPGAVYAVRGEPLVFSGPIRIVGGPYHPGDMVSIERAACNNSGRELVGEVEVLLVNVGTTKVRILGDRASSRSLWPVGCSTLLGSPALPDDLQPGVYQIYGTTYVPGFWGEFPARWQSQTFTVVAK